MIPQELYRKTLGSFPSGVTIVTAYDERGRVTGLTASAFSALSMDPPLVLVCPQYNSESYRVLSASTHFAINILAGHQSPEAYAFAKRGEEKAEAIAKLDIERGEHGVPVLKGAVATIQCSHWKEYEGGDHAILVGHVESMSVEEETAPMVYCRGKMGPWALEAC